MRHRTRLTRLRWVLLAFLMLAACSGGGGNSTSLWDSAAWDNSTWGP